MITVEQLVSTLDGDDAGVLSKAEWIRNLQNCAGLAHHLADNVDESGNTQTFLN